MLLRADWSPRNSPAVLGSEPERKPKALRAAKSIHLEGVSPIEHFYEPCQVGIGAHELSESGCVLVIGEIPDIVDVEAELDPDCATVSRQISHRPRSLACVQVRAVMEILRALCGPYVEPPILYIRPVNGPGRSR